MNRNKNLLILHYLGKTLSNFSDRQKNFSLLFLLNPVPQKIFFVVLLCEINCIKNRTMSLVSKSICFSRGCLFSPTLGPRPLSSVLGPHLVDPQNQNIAGLNTILLFNFDVVITLKL